MGGVPRLFICVHQCLSVVAPLAFFARRLASLPPCNLPCGSRVSMLRLRTMRVRVPFREPVTVALDTLRAHKLRSFLMLLGIIDRKSTRLNSSHSQISYAVFCLKKKKETARPRPGHLA